MTTRPRPTILSAVGLALLLAALVAPAARTAAAPQAAGDPVDVATLARPIDGAAAQYVQRAIHTAEGDGAQALVLRLDTPGGSSTAMRDIIAAILAARVPVIVFVSPPGARAASAGTFITLAADVAAMGPHTTIGAAHPVGPNGENLPDELNQKATNDAVALIRDLAASHGRNADWAERAVRESVDVDAEAAYALKVVDLLADDVPDLLARLDGRALERRGVTLHTAGAPQRAIDPSLAETVLGVLANPDISYLLFVIGLVALVVEAFHPGGWLPGIIGVACLLLALAGFGSLPVNWAGAGLIVLAVILFVTDLHVAGFGLTVAGGVAFLLGSLLLFQPLPLIGGPAVQPRLDATTLSVNPFLIGGTTLAMAGVFIFGFSTALRTRRLPAQTGREALVGAHGVATTDVLPGSAAGGQVNVRGEVWSARADEALERGTRVKVEGVDGLTVRVRRAEKRDPG